MDLSELQKQSKLRQKRPTKELWATSMWVADLTGWNNNKLRLARKKGFIRYKEAVNGRFLYDLYSIPPVFLLCKCKCMATEHKGCAKNSDV